MRQQNTLNDAGAIEARQDRSTTIARLVASHGVDTLLISIPRVARMLGYAPSTLYGYIKNGTFFLPYRVVNGSPAVAVDDLVVWLASRDMEIAPRRLATVRAEAGRANAERADSSSEAWRAAAQRKALAAASAKSRAATLHRHANKPT